LDTAVGKKHIDYTAGRGFGLGGGKNIALEKNAAYVKYNSPSNFGLEAYSAATLTVNDEAHTQTRATAVTRSSVKNCNISVPSNAAIYAATTGINIY
jgi:hypothetical protein